MPRLALTGAPPAWPVSTSDSSTLGAVEVARARRKTRPRPSRQDPNTIPDALNLSPDLKRLVDPIGRVLTQIAKGNGAEGAKLPTRRAVALVLADFPDRDVVEAARGYRRWQLGDNCRTPHRDVVLGFRRQLQRAPKVARQSAPPTDPEEERRRRREKERKRLEDAER